MSSLHFHIFQTVVEMITKEFFVKKEKYLRVCEKNEY